MDSFFQTLFILFIIFSFLAPLFKKKRGQQQTNKPQKPEDDNLNSSSGRPSSSTTPERDRVNYDILQEIEGMFNKPAETETTEKQTESVTTETEEENYREPEWHEPSKSEASLDKEWHSLTTAADYEKEKEVMDAKTKEFERLLNKKIEINMVAINIRNSIKNPETLKEYFVISEILGKPKGFETY